MPAQPEIIDAYCTLGSERETRLDAATLLRHMDAAGIRRAVIAPEDREIACRNAEGNRRIAAIARQHADRFVPACSVNPWRGDEACGLLREAIADGAKMLVFAPALQGFYFTDELTSPLLAVAAEHALPVYVHTGPHSAAGPTQVVIVAQQHPETLFILGHCGVTDHAHDMPAILRDHALPNLWFETSYLRWWGLPALGALKGGSRLIFGSSAPRNDPAFELARAASHWPIADHADFYGGNIAKLIAGVKTPTKGGSTA